MQKNQLNSIYERIYDIIVKIPRGHVATYGQIANLAGIGQPRRVGYALRILPNNTSVPWHRVINAKGEISRRRELGCSELQRTLLEEEGVIFDNNASISLLRFRWQPQTHLA